jgi:antitoxin ParD1/3/4
MSARKQSVSFTEAAFAFAEDLVRSGEYPNVSAAVSGELVRARAAREAQHVLLEAEVARRLSAPIDEWVPLGEPSDLTRAARARLVARGQEE